MLLCVEARPLLRWMEAKTAGDLACEKECKKLACSIQKCLSRRSPRTRTNAEVYQNECEGEIRAWKECCERAKRAAEEEG